MMTPIPPAVQQVLDVYETSLRLVKFGDLEATVLASAAEEVVLAATALESAEALLETARATLLEKQEALLQKTQRALAYARVYAEGDPELAARVEGIALARSSRRAQKVDDIEGGQPIPTVGARQRRARPRPSDPTAGMLDLPDADRAAS
jgi:multidrug efflux pump subunit AcrA (membrane-fusion protein)